MDKKDVSKILNSVLDQLHTLEETDSTVLHVSNYKNDFNCFMYGDADTTIATLCFAMMRHEEIKEVVVKAAAFIGEVEKEFGDKVRNHESIVSVKKTITIDADK